MFIDFGMARLMRKFETMEAKIASEKAQKDAQDHKCAHTTTIARPDDDITLMECLTCGEKVRWIRFYYPPE